MSAIPRHFFVAPLVCLAGMLTIPAARAVVLVESGRPAATIVIPDEPAPLTGWPRTYWVGQSGYPDGPVPKDKPATVEYAALFLQDYLKQISGATLPIVRAAQAPAEGALVLVGASALTANWGIDAAKLKPEGFRIKTAPRGVAIVGEVAPADSFAAGHDRGTLFGVYELLERLGVRWYFPGEFGTIVPAMATVAVPETDFTDAPFLQLRAGGVSASAAPWHPCLRTGGSSRLFVCHTTFLWQQYFSASHPEYFTMRPDGARTTLQKDGTRKTSGHLCYSEPGVLTQELANIETYLGGDKSRPYLWGDMRIMQPNDLYAYHCPNDVMNVRGECYCPECLRARRYDNGKAKHSEVVYGFMARLARGVAQKWPSRRVAVATGYDSYQWPPRTTEWPDNLDMMYIVLRGPQMQVDPAIWDEEALLFRSWQSLVGNDRGRMAVWLYYCYPEMFTEAPILAPDTLAKWYKTYAPHITGVFNNGSRAKDVTGRRTFPMVYLSGRLQWNPEADTRAILDEFYRLSFGPAEKPMAAFFNHLIDRWEHARWSEIPPSVEVPNRLIYKDVYRPEDLRLLKQWLAEAATAAGKDTIHRRRVDWWTEAHQPFFDEAAGFHAWLDNQPRWQATRFATPPPLEGGSVWEQVEAKPLVGLIKGDTPSLGTAIRVGYDTNGLYVLAQALETNLTALAMAAKDGEDTELLKDDTVSLQLWTGRSAPFGMPSFYEIRVNPKGITSQAVVIEPVFLDGFHHSDRFAWTAKGIRAAAAVKEKEWTVGLAVPWEALPELENAIPAQLRLQVERRRAGPSAERTVLSPILAMSYEYPLNRFATVEFKP
ncbi:MAG: DUF4838 domain-containing protein [Kiritimatiellae bacterium]|nr:DUF4838 domain-containing protein [Kiritimatiellia bacterium]